jgi:hypothetical protein
MQWDERYRQFLLAVFMLAGVITFCGCPDWQTIPDARDPEYSGRSHH